MGDGRLQSAPDWQSALFSAPLPGEECVSTQSDTKRIKTRTEIHINILYHVHTFNRLMERSKNIWGQHMIWPLLVGAENDSNDASDLRVYFFQLPSSLVVH